MRRGRLQGENYRVSVRTVHVEETVRQAKSG